MGMAASQARLLSITSRLSDNEFRAQDIMRTKMQNSLETGKLSEDYRRSLDATKMIGQAYTAEDGKVNLDLSYGLVAGNSQTPLGTQYVVTNAQGELLISETTAAKYKNSTKDHDMTSPDGYGKAFDNFITTMGLKTADPLVEPKMPACMTDLNGEYQQSLAAYRTWIEVNQELTQQKKEFNSTVSKLNPKQSKYTATEAGRRRFEILLADPARAAKITAFAKLGTGDGANIAGRYTTLSYGTTNVGYNVPEMSSSMNVYRWDTSLSDEDNLSGYLGAVMKSIADGNASSEDYTDNVNKEWGNIFSDPAINNFFAPQAITVPIYDESGNNVTGTYVEINNKLYNQSEAAIYNAAQAKLTAATNKEANAKANADAKEAAWRAAAPQYEQEINDYNKAQSEYLTKYEAFCKDKYSIYSDPKQAKYYEQLFMQIASKGALAIPDDQLNDKNWFQFALKSGQVFLEKSRQDGTWEPCHWKTEPSMMEIADTDKAGSIKSKYEIDLSKLERKEDALDMQLKNIETEHSALQTEFDGVKTVIQKNVERSFKTLG